jgi:hypothetical protein
MNFRSYVLIISLFFLFAGGSFGLAEQMMTPVSGVMGPRKTIVDELGLKMRRRSDLGVVLLRCAMGQIKVKLRSLVSREGFNNIL